MKNSKIGLLQATGLLVYVFLIAGLIHLAPTLFGAMTTSPIVLTILFLLLFVISALISGSIILGYPVALFFENKKLEAISILIWSVVWLVILFASVGIIAVLIGNFSI